MGRNKKTEEEKKEEIVETSEELTQAEELEKEERKSKKKKEEKGMSVAKKKLLERAKELSSLGEKSIKEELKEEVAKEKEKEKISTPSDDYLKYGVYLGTKVITPHMRKFVYKRRADGIAVIDVNLTDKYLKDFIQELIKYNPEDFIIVCKREAGWKAVKLFSELTGVRIFTKKYPAGIITNPALQDFFEPKMLLICDPWIDKNALSDAKTTKKRVLALCDTNNYTQNIEILIPCNNKSNKSIGFIFYQLAKEYLKAKNIDKPLPEIDDFVGEEK